MPPKRRVTRTVRKSTAKKPSAASDAPPPPSPPTPAAAPEDAVPAVATLIPELTPVAVASPAPSASQTPVSAIPAASDASPLVPAPTPPSPAAPAEKTPEPCSVSTVPAATAADAVPVPQTHATPAAAREPVADEAPPAAAQAPARKTTTRVVKKVVKKIVKRKVPKVTPSSSSLVAKPEEENTEVSAVGKGTPEVVVSVDRQPASAKAEEEKTSPSPVVTDRKPDNRGLGSVTAKSKQMEKDNVDAEEAKYPSMEEDKPDTIEAAATETTATAFGDDEAGISERQRRRKTEIFIGGLDRDAKEEDVRKVFEKAGEILEIRMMMNTQTGKNKGYAFVRYKEATQAKKAVSEFSKVEICGKLCGAAALEGNDTIFLGNIDKKWKKEDVIKLLQDIGIEKIDTVTVMIDPKNTDLNRGFAFLELETNRDAQIAYKKLQKKDVFGKGRNIKVSWAEPLNNPDEEEMQKVKSVYVEGIPSSWDETKVRECFKKFGDIERVVLARNMQSAKRKDFAFVNYTTREAALSCIESFDNDELLESGSKVNVKVSLAKPVRKGKQNKGAKSNAEEKPKPVAYGTKTNLSEKGKSFRGSTSTGSEAKKSSTTHELLNVLREQAAWRQGQTSYTRDTFHVPVVPEYSHTVSGGKRAFPEPGEDFSYSRGYPRARLDSSYQVPSYGALAQGRPGLSIPYYQRPDVGNSSGSFYGAPEARQPSSSSLPRQVFPPYGSNMYPRY